MLCHSVACGMVEPNAVSNAIGYAKRYSRSHQAVIRVYDEAGQRSIETHEHIGRLVAVLSLNRLSTLIAQTGVSLARQFEFHWARKINFSFRAKSA
jgi:hypothetical protein